MAGTEIRALQVEVLEVAAGTTLRGLQVEVLETATYTPETSALDSVQGLLLSEAPALMDFVFPQLLNGREFF